MGGSAGDGPSSPAIFLILRSLIEPLIILVYRMGQLVDVNERFSGGRTNCMIVARYECRVLSDAHNSVRLRPKATPRVEWARRRT